MKTRTIYQDAKWQLKHIADWAKSEKPKDLPYIRQVINDTCDSICKDYQFSEYRRNLLALYSCKLHPKYPKR
jgi:hypothetical protein